MTPITKITLLLIAISLFYTTDTTKTTETTETTWFNKKYLKEIYDQYYIYTFENMNNIQNECLETHKPAVMAALTGTSFLHKHRVRAKMPPPIKYFKLHRSNYKYIFEITVWDVILFIENFIYYIWKTFVVVNIIITTLSVNLIVAVLFFGQY